GQAIERVIDSFGDDQNDQDQIFVQPMLEGVAMAGVAFSRSPGGGPYFIINYDDRTGLTERVTAGAGDNLETFYCLKSRRDSCHLRWRRSLRCSVSWKLCWGAMPSTWNSPWAA